MQTRREYLVGLGLAKPGRGRLSLAGKEALAKAKAEGMRFSDDETTGPSAPAREPRDSPKPKSAGMPEYLTPSEYRFPEAEYYAVGVSDKKRYSLRECCNHCRVSLVNHGCNSPVILGDIAVLIKPVSVK